MILGWALARALGRAVAPQQTLGNLIAGLVLLSARPFTVGDRIRLQAGGLAGRTDGDVESLGLLYTALATGEDRTMVPNSVVLNAAVVPLREPDGVDMRVRLPEGVRPSQLQECLDDMDVAVRFRPHIALEEMDGATVVARVRVTPVSGADGGRLADQVLEAVSRVSREPSRLAALA